MSSLASAPHLPLSARRKATLPTAENLTYGLLLHRSAFAHSAHMRCPGRRGTQPLTIACPYAYGSRNELQAQISDIPVISVWWRAPHIIGTQTAPEPDLDRHNKHVSQKEYPTYHRSCN